MDVRLIDKSGEEFIFPIKDIYFCNNNIVKINTDINIKEYIYKDDIHKKLDNILYILNNK
jgi:hypothetical protein